MPTYVATELDLTTGKPTGQIEYYEANDLIHAQARVLYTRSLTNGTAKPGNLVADIFAFVHVGDRSWTVHLEK